MSHRIEVASIIPETRAQVRKKQLRALSLGSLEVVWLVDVYTIDRRSGKKQLKQIAAMLTNPVTQEAVIDKPVVPKRFSWAIEVCFLPGVTDNVGTTAQESIEDLFQEAFKDQEAVYTSQITFIAGTYSRAAILKLAENLYNPLIQRVRIKSAVQFKKDRGMGLVVPRVKLRAKSQVNTVNLEVGNKALAKIGKEGIANTDGTRRGPLALDLTYLTTIRNYFRKVGRKPTDIELESLAQTWSEHCKHTIFADPIDEIKEGLFNRYIKGATEKIRRQKGKKDSCVSVFTDNSGAIEFDRDYLVTDKVETHNSPSALDPFGGAVTGIVGVNRDTIGFGRGAKPVLNRYGFCFADPRDQTALYKGPNHTQKMLSARRIMDGVITGVNAGGNCSGIPTPQGFIFFDRGYRGKPLVFVGTVGLIPRKIAGKLAHRKKAQTGDYIVMVGGRVGQDGIHGATFSSEAMDAGSPAGAVQIGDPITQKKLSDALIKEARDQQLYHSITDNGAGGLSCSVAEMAKEAGGFTVELEKVPLKYPGLAPWQIWISESQERMTLAVPPKRWKTLQKLLRSRGVEATVIGRFTDSGKAIVRYRGKIILDLGMEFLHNGLPVRHLKTKPSVFSASEPKIPKRQDLTRVLLEILARPNVAGFAFISQQFDHEVQAGSVLKPLQGKGRVNGEATVVRPVLTSPRGVVVSQCLYPSYSELDPYRMAACALDTAVRQTVGVGASLGRIVLLDNFCWCSASEPERLWQLKQAARACHNYALAYGTPFISGKDSMFNDFKGFTAANQPIKISVPPTLLISALGIVRDVRKVVSLEAKVAGDWVYILGETHEELGGSEYYAWWSQKTGKERLGTTVPQVKAKLNKRLYRRLHQAINQRLVASVKSVGLGGLGIALAKVAIGGRLGIDISLTNLPGSVENNPVALFSESQGRLIVTVAPKHRSHFEQLFTQLPVVRLGRVTHDSVIRIRGVGSERGLEIPVTTALKAYQSTFKNF